MRRIRIGNDITLRWEIFRKTSEGQEPYELNTDNLHLRLVTPYRKEDVKGFGVTGNVITWTFYGKDQKHLGAYGLELIENRGAEGMATIDTCEAFELVAHSCLESDDDAPAIGVYTVNLRGVMSSGNTSVDPELLESYVPMSRDFSDDFNNDFAR